MKDHSRTMRVMLAGCLTLVGWSVLADPPVYSPLPEAATPFDPYESPKALLRTSNRAVVNDHQIGFDTRAVSITEYVKSDSVLGVDSLPLWSSYYAELSDYLEDALAASRRDAIRRELVGRARLTDSAKPEANRYELPVRIPEWAKKLGLSKPALSLSGSYTLQVKAQSNWNKAQEEAGTANKFPDFSPEQIPNVNLTGNIGKFVSMTLTWNQEGFGATQSQDLHLKYAGEKPEDTEDDILQEAEFGLINLALPGTSLTGYSEAASGLLGLKAKMRFGDLDFTVVGGTEQGQTQKQKIGRTAKDVVSPLISDRDMDIGRDFFLSYEWKTKYQANRNAQDVIGMPQVLRVFARIKESDKRDHPDWSPFYTGRAVARDSLGGLGYSTAEATWRELVSEKDWHWDKGVLRIKSGVGTTALAAMWRVNAREQHGAVPGATTVDTLVLLSDDDQPGNIDLRAIQLRNRYYKLNFVAEKDRQNMKVRILDRSSSKGDASVDSTGEAWAAVFGLVDKSKGTVNYNNSEIFDWDNRAIIFPDLEPFRKFGRGALYDTTKTALTQIPSRFAIEITSRSASDSIKIGSRDMASVSGSNCVDILEGSEVLTLNGSTRLVKGIDYDVQYQTGTITLLSDRAKNPSAEISVDFSCRPFFSLETRSVFGARLEYQMPWLGKQSVLGGTFLYRKETVTDPRPQLQREPNQAMLWGANLRLAGESEMLTDLTARIPFAHVKGESKWRLELEGAQSWNNPNIEGYALVDDFESSRQDNDLPVYAQSWFHASPPGGDTTSGRSGYEDSLDYRHQGTFVWSSNSSELLKNIYPDHDDGSATPQKQTVLQLKLRPNELSGAGHSWGGMMRPMPSSWKDNSSARYLEVVARASGGELSFDFGQISEDLSVAGEAPNARIDGEDVVTGSATGSQQHDRGLDGIDDTIEHVKTWTCYGKDCHVSMDYTRNPAIADSTKAISDPAGDNFDASHTLDNDPPISINGTENNNRTVDGGTNTWYDSEDMDRNGLDLVNAFDRYTIRLGGPNATPAQKLLGGWKLYRIPLEDKTLQKGGGANWSALKAVRVFFHGLSNKNGANLFEDRIQIARMSLVGNQWKASGHMTKNDDTIIVDTSATGDWTSTTKVIVPDSTRLSASVVNNQDDNASYRTWGVPESKDASSGAKLKEQSLRLVYKTLARDFKNGAARPDTGVATRIYESARDFTLYRNLDLLVYHASADGVSASGQTPVRVGIQFGTGLADMANQPYYEYSYNPVPAACPVGDGTCTESSLDARKATMDKSWQDNQIQIALSQLSVLKAHRLAANASSDVVFKEPVKLGLHQGPASRDDSIAVKGDPSLSSVSWMRIWVRANPQEAGNKSTTSGEIWVNDFKLDSPYDGIGTAMRGSAQVNFSDLLDLSGSADYQGGDFVPMGQKRPEMSNQKSTAHATGTAALSLEKFLPEAWKSRLPVNYVVTAGLDRPWAVPSQDQTLSHDDLSQIASDIWNDDMRRDSADIANRASKAYQTLAVTRTLSTSWTRARDEAPGISAFLTNTFFARPKLAWTYTEQGTIAPTHRDSTKSHSVRLEYDFSPPPPPQLKPFGKSTSKWVPSVIQGLTVQPWPTTITATLGDLDYLDGTHSSLATDKDSLLKQTLERRAGLTHAVSSDWQILDFLRLSSNVKSTRGWNQPAEAKLFNPATGLVEAWPLIFDWDTTRVGVAGGEPGERALQGFGLLRNENGRQVGFTMEVNPKILPWVTTTGSFQANATINREDPTAKITGAVGAQDTVYQQFFRHDHSDNFRGSVRLDVPSVFRTVQSYSPGFLKTPLESARKLADKWRWTGVGVEYSVDNRTSGVRQTLDYSANREGLDAAGLWRWEMGLGDAEGFRAPWDLVTGNRSKSGFGQYEPSRLDDPSRYPLLTDTLASESGADRASQLNTRSYRVTGTSEITIPNLQIRLEPSVSYQISWDERWHEPWSVDTTKTWPQIALNTSLPNFAPRLPLIKKWFESMTANNTSSWEVTRKIYPHRVTANSTNNTWRFAPLVGLQAKLKGNWTFDNRVNMAVTHSTLTNKKATANGACPDGLGLASFYTDTVRVLIDRCFEEAGTSQDRSWDYGDEGTATYRIQTKKGIQILKWFVKLDNDLVITFRGGWTHQRSNRVASDANPTNTPLSDVTTVYGGSNATYNFTSKLVAQFDAKYQQTERTVTSAPQGETNHDISFLASLQYRF